ncbi:hypothetical protein FSP39_016531 [Pinctada imbricata]|uniref:BEN domain-containing protein n=1 Tax=Pinctada imbricata TaxID=66713 RepID=A0AA89C881_PINIB|nr:hypothetical protein FSP39_016531 [Pinctada imbricata]
MQTFNRPLNVSDIVNWVSANTPNHTGAGVTIVPVTEAQSLPVITPLASCVSPIIESEELPVERDFTDDYPHISALPPLDPPSSPTVRRPLFSSPIEPQENRRPLTELTSHVNNVQSSQTSAISSQKLVELNCSKDDPLKEINDFNDISDGKYEFRIRRETLARLKSSSCSDGNFLWSVTRKIFRTDELVGKNFFGRKGRDPLSPRRVHALKHAYVDFCGSDYKAFTTAVCSINNGIRSLNR